MKVLVLGAGGMAGHVMALRLQEAGVEVVGFARRPLAYCETIVGDAVERESVAKAVRSRGHDAVVNCVGILNRAVDERPYEGILLNSCLPHLLAALTAGTAARVVHLSTDCVFSGCGAGGYTETSVPDADSPYGRSKALGELADSRNLTIRTSFVGPDRDARGTGLFNWFMAREGQVGGYTRVFWTGVTAPVLAEAVLSALEREVTGLCHLVNNERISKRDLLLLFNRLRRSPALVEADDSAVSDKSLRATRPDTAFAVPSYAAMVDDMGCWIRRHAALYPHYAIAENEQ